MNLNDLLKRNDFIVVWRGLNSAMVSYFNKKKKR